MSKLKPTFIGGSSVVGSDEADTPSSPPGLLVTGHFKGLPGYRAVRRRGTQDWLLTYTIAGSGFYRQPGIEIRTRPGDLVLLEPGAYHHYGTPAKGYWQFLWAHFIARPHWMPWLNWPAHGKGMRGLSISDPATRGRVKTAFQRCHDDTWSGDGALIQDLALNGLEEVILLATRNQMTAGHELTFSPEIRRVVDQMADHVNRPYRIHDLARQAGLSESRFAHRFKEETGDSVIAYLIKLRLRHAARLLEFSGASVKEVAATVGFDSAFYFSKQFKRHFQMSPRDYCKRRDSLQP